MCRRVRANSRSGLLWPKSPLTASHRASRAAAHRAVIKARFCTFSIVANPECLLTKLKRTTGGGSTGRKFINLLGGVAVAWPTMAPKQRLTAVVDFLDGRLPDAHRKSHAGLTYISNRS
jgi:hypothetical protein